MLENQFRNKNGFANRLISYFKFRSCFTLLANYGHCMRLTVFQTLSCLSPQATG